MVGLQACCDMLVVTDASRALHCCAQHFSGGSCLLGCPGPAGGCCFLLTCAPRTGGDCDLPRRTTNQSWGCFSVLCALSPSANPGAAAALPGRSCSCQARYICWLHNSGPAPPKRGRLPSSRVVQACSRLHCCTRGEGQAERGCACRWHRCSDVFFLCMSLALLLDGRVWPLEDAHKVEQLLGLIYHVTGRSRTVSSFPWCNHLSSCGPPVQLSMQGCTPLCPRG